MGIQASAWVVLVSTPTNIVLGAGVLAFGNEWMQTGSPNWRMPIGTLGAMLVTSGVTKVSPPAGTAFAVIIFIAAMTVRFNGKSVAEEALSVLPSPNNAKKGKKR
jgi:TRAP-type C4-dicarboxylate transport system permease small subunit